MHGSRSWGKGKSREGHGEDGRRRTPTDECLLPIKTSNRSFHHQPHHSIPPSSHPRDHPSRSIQKPRTRMQPSKSLEPAGTSCFNHPRETIGGLTCLALIAWVCLRVLTWFRLWCFWFLVFGFRGVNGEGRGEGGGEAGLDASV